MKFTFIACALLISVAVTAQNIKPLRVGVVGLNHDHVGWILNYKSPEIEIVGIAEQNKEIVEKYSKRYGFSRSLVYNSLEEMVDKTKPEAVLAFNSIFDHLRVVEYCAPKGIHVMVEKPLAVSYAHAQKMVTLAKKHNIFLLTNYETTWYGSNKKAYELIYDEKKIGDIRKIVFHTGHQGPIEIGCSKEFLSFLTDPVLNGGGAITDFGCYGANITTWLMKGETPLTVSATTQTIKPDLYPKVDDEATITLTYPKAQVIIQASWNWPFGRKDMEVYGKTGFVFCADKENMTLMEDAKKPRVPLKADPLAEDRNDPFIYFTNVIRGRIKLQPTDMSSLENNEIVVKILEAAKVSAKTGKVVVWKEYFSR